MFVFFVFAFHVSDGVGRTEACQSVDMAVGIIIGGAFGKIVSSLVDDILMPLIGLVTGGINFTELKYVIKPAEINAAGEEIVAATTLNYGLFIQNVVDFLIIALVIFMMIRAINSLRRKHKEPEAPAPEPSDEVKLLTEIRNLLDDAKVAWQTGELGRVDLGGGGTVAMYIAALNVDVVDVGVPVLSMHAPFEVVSKQDVYQTYRAFRAYVAAK